MQKISNDLDNRYPWLDEMFHFTSIELKVEDNVKHEVNYLFRDGVKYLKIFSVSATPETLPKKIYEAMRKHQLAECSVLDKDGEEIEHYHFESHGDVLVSLCPEFDSEIVEATGFHFSKVQQNLDTDEICLVREVGSDLKEAAFFVLYNFAEHETIIVYEIVFA